jgi:hypothetical protein
MAPRGVSGLVARAEGIGRWPSRTIQDGRRRVVAISRNPIRNPNPRLN